MLCREENEYNIELNLRTAKELLDKLENQLEYWQWERKLLLENAEGLGSISYDKEIISGGTYKDNNVSIDKIIDSIDPKIKLLKSRIKNLMKYIEKEMKTIGEYEPIEAKIITLREEKKMKWDDIAALVNYSERHCRRIYDNRYKKRKKIKKG